MVRGWKFHIYKVEELYYPCSENKCADQFTVICFRISKNPVFSMRGSSHNSVTVNLYLLPEADIPVKSFVCDYLKHHISSKMCFVEIFYNFKNFDLKILIFIP